MPGILDWSLKIDEIGPNGCDMERTASAKDLGRLAGDLGVVSVEQLAVRVSVKAVGSNRYRLSGHMAGSLTQACVVSLEPVKGEIAEDFAVEFWPAAQIGPPAEGEHGVLEAEIPEPIEHGRIDIGRIVFEHVAAGLDPYPRRDDASFDAQAFGVGGGDKPNPFAVLAKLKPKPNP